MAFTIPTKQQAQELYRAHGGNTPTFTLEGMQCWARVVDVYDGDTLTVVLPLHGHYAKFSVRMYGIDTCEIKSKLPETKAKALAARQRLMELIFGDALPSTMITKKQIQQFFEDHVCVVWLQCKEKDKYGRLLAEVYATPQGAPTLASMLIQEGLGYSYFGDAKLTEEQQIETLG